MPPPAHGLASRLIAGPTLRTQSDRRLVKLVREGYESAFEEIVRRYGRALGRYAAAIVGHRSEDVTQDAFSKALLALRHDDAEIELRPWLYRIVRNTALNDLRDRPAAAAELAETIATGSNPAEAIERHEELTELMERLRALPKTQRAAIVMRELEGLSHDEIAAALGLSGGGARQAIYRARRALRDGLGMLVPLPLLKAFLGPEGSAAAEAASGIAGAGLAVKATAATVLVAGTVGAGVALQETAKGPDGRDEPAPAVASERSQEGAGATDGDSSGHSGSGSGRSGEDRSGSERGGSSGPGHGGSIDGEEESDRSGSGGGGFDEPDGDDRSGPGDGSNSSGTSSGPGSGEDGESLDGDSFDSSGSGSGDDFESSGSGSSGTSGSGSSNSDDSD
jgi:RNA polymerase sigma factor (sigma-70 family)